MELIDLHKMLKRLPQSPFSSETVVVPLEGASSDLKYYRIKEDDISMIFLETVGEKSIFRSFIHIGRFLKEKGMGVPEIYYYDLGQCVALIEDLGDTSLYSEFSDGRNKGQFIAFYQRVLETLAEIQVRGAKGMKQCPMLKDKIFDYRVLCWETSYFKRYFLQRYCNLSIENEERLDREFKYLAQSLAREPLYFMHRDFQSQNVFIKDGKIRLIDFQGAHQGMLHYDLVSLLKDAYIVIPDHIRKRLMDYYLDILKSQWKLDLDRERFEITFSLAGLQRNMQALGAFSFLSLVKGKERFRQYIPAGVNYLRSALKEIPGFDTLKEILTFPIVYQSVSGQICHSK